MDIVAIENHIVLIGAVIAALGGVGGALLYVKKRLIDPIKETAVQVVVNFESASKMLPILQKVYDEFKPNGGSSMKDSINRIEQSVLNLKTGHHVIMNRTDVGHYETDGDGNCTWANEAYCELTGYSLHDILGKGWISALHPDDREIVTKEWYNSIKDKRHFSLAYRYLSPSGAVQSIRCHAVMTFDSDGICIGSLGTVYPIG